MSNNKAGIMHLKQKITFAGSTIDIKGKLTIIYKYLIFIKYILGGLLPKLMKFKIPPKMVIPYAMLLKA